MPQSADNKDLEKTRLNLGFIPLTDCAPLVVAKEMGFFADQGLQVELSKETSWANIRDKLAIGVLDGAHMLAPMTLGATLDMGPVCKPVVTAFCFGLNGSAVTVSESLYQDMLATAPEAMRQRPLSAEAMRRVIALRKAQGRPPLRLGMVFPLSTHNYQLRYWLAASGIHPDRDLVLEAVPPAQMVGRLRDARLDGYCVGEPWNSLAVREGIGRVMITGQEIWNASPEKVLGVNEEWAEQHPQTHRALIRALMQAARWLDAPENRPQAVEMLSMAHYVNAPADVIRMSLNGTFQYARTEFPKSLPNFNIFHRHAANFPWRSHALWLLAQMVRWGQIDEAPDMHALARRVYRTELNREVAAESGLSVPEKDYKTEGEHDSAWLMEGKTGLALGSDALFSGDTFNPGQLLSYLRGLKVHAMQMDLDELAAINKQWTEDESDRLLVRQARVEGAQPLQA